MTSDLNVSPAAVVSFLTPPKSHPLMPSCCASWTRPQTFAQQAVETNTSA